RLQVPHVREYLEDREVTAWFLLDLSPSVDFGSGQARKREIAQDFVALVGRLLTRHGNRVGALLYGSAVEGVIPAGSGRRQVLRILHAMQQRAAPGARKQAAARRTDLADLLGAAAQVVRRRSLIFVVSDFFSAPGWAERLAHMVRRHEMLAVRLYDPLESALPDLGLIPFVDSETGEQVLVDTHDAGFRERFAEAAERREEGLREGFARAGADVLELSTEDDLVESIRRFSDLRRRRSRMPQASRTPESLPGGRRAA
ncbi:MAG TPA: VWA domain-containing protein, partial [Burkholderiales bacterium]|nr:VWA domain-containing protein [Burkholderiales bacterium]